MGYAFQMPEYTATVTVDENAELLFAFLADPASIPAYLPAVREARFVGREDLLVTLADGTARHAAADAARAGRLVKQED